MKREEITKERNKVVRESNVQSDVLQAKIIVSRNNENSALK